MVYSLIKGYGSPPVGTRSVLNLCSRLQLAKPFSFLGSPVVPFSPFCYGVSLLKPNSSKKGTLIIKGLLGNLVVDYSISWYTIEYYS